MRPPVTVIIIIVIIIIVIIVISPYKDDTIDEFFIKTFFTHFALRDEPLLEHFIFIDSNNHELVFINKNNMSARGLLTNLCR